MPTIAALLRTLKTFGLSLPGTQPKSPWPGHDDVAVNDKTFAFMSVHDGALHVRLKLPASGAQVRQLPNAGPAGYGLDKSGWVALTFSDDAPATLDTVKRWMLESYRAQAPRRLWKELVAEQPWVEAGGLPEARRPAKG